MTVPASSSKNADLIGIPVKVVIGKSLAEGTVEISLRRDSGIKEAIPVAEAAAHVMRLVIGLKSEMG